MKTTHYLLIFLFIVTGCRKPYDPPAITSAGGDLVVEGIINSGNDSTVIKLSRTVQLSANMPVNETNAKVSVESDQNVFYSLSETSPGTYTCGPLNLDAAHLYRLNIFTSDNIKYQSDFEAVKHTAPIDSIGYMIKSNGIQIYLNTHDATNSSRYYRWDYQETWQFYSKYNSEYYVTADTILPRPANQQVHYCFSNDVSTNIILGSTADLTSDIVSQNPITFVAASSEKLEAKYSILVKQYAITKDAFNFWTNLKKNTEQLGSIFDAQPSQINGNIHCISNPAIPVIGYISVTNAQSKRIFVSNSSLPQYFFGVYPYDCSEDSTLIYNPVTKLNDVKDFIIDAAPGTIDAAGPIIKNNALIGYFRTSPICADCTLRGTTTQPVFWK